MPYKIFWIRIVIHLYLAFFFLVLFIGPFSLFGSRGNWGANSFCWAELFGIVGYLNFQVHFFSLWILSNQTEHGGKNLGFLQEMKHARYFLALNCSIYGLTNTKIKTLRCCLELIMVI
jgi:hypothetical protein